MANHLIIKLGALGDVVMASTILSAIHSMPGEQSITWVAGRSATELLGMLDCAVHVVPVDETVISKGSIFKRIQTILKICWILRKHKFDFCYILYRDWRYHVFRLGLHRNTVVKSYRGKNALIPGRYHGYECVRIAVGEDIAAAQEINFPKLRYTTINQDQNIAKGYLLIAPGEPSKKASDLNRQWPLDNYYRIALLLVAKGVKVAIIGQDKTGLVEEKFKYSQVKSYINKTSISTLLQAMNNSIGLITHDSGAMHLMSLCEKPTIAIFGPTLPSEKIYHTELTKIIQPSRQFMCSPCYNGHSYMKCRKAENCLTSITVDEVYKEALTFFSI